jgi:hypothetical protein
MAAAKRGVHSFAPTNLDVTSSARKTLATMLLGFGNSELLQSSLHAPYFPKVSVSPSFKKQF